MLRQGSLNKNNQHIENIRHFSSARPEQRSHLIVKFSNSKFGPDRF
jgi:hypothetical protein